MERSMDGVPAQVGDHRASRNAYPLTSMYLCPSDVMNDNHANRAGGRRSLEQVMRTDRGSIPVRTEQEAGLRIVPGPDRRRER